MNAHREIVERLINEAQRLIALRNVGSDMIRQRIQELRALWDQLIEAVATRKKHLLEALAYFQFFSGFPSFLSLSYTCSFRSDSFCSVLFLRVMWVHAWRWWILGLRW